MHTFFNLRSFILALSIAIIGTSGAIGSAALSEARRRYPHATIYSFSRSTSAHTDGTIYHSIDITDERSIAAATKLIDAPLDLVFVATGILHEGDVTPEKSLRDISLEKFEHIFAINTIGPALIAKHFIPKLNRKNRAVFAALSARVGSIEDNRLGGWYAYRASKAALNMVIKNTSIEAARRNKEAIIVGLHPGTVDSPLSKPFQGNVPEGKLFTPEHSASKLLDVIEGLTPTDTGYVFDFNGVRIPA